MSHSHGPHGSHSHGVHSHSHGEHGHSHGPADGPTPEFADTSIPDSELSPNNLNRRRFLQGVGAVGAIGAVTTVGLPARRAAAVDVTSQNNDDGTRYLYYNGDHHIHTRYSVDAIHDVATMAAKAEEYGLGWMVITDHGREAHVKYSIDKITPDIEAARGKFSPLIFQGLEWNIPGAEHGTVFVPPGPNAVDVLKGFEAAYDGVVLQQAGVIAGATENKPETEKRSMDGLNWLKSQVLTGRIPLALMLANHPARRGVDSPHEFRQWRDTAPEIAIGMEGAPGHQAAGIAKPDGPGSGRGYYANSPSADSFPGYTPEYYVTWGGFDYFTAEVGGLWDSLLSEGRPWSITANSDAHAIYKDSIITTGTTASYDAPGSGDKGDPVDSGTPQTNFGDFWPGYYSSTWVGSSARNYLSIMQGLQAGRIYVTHGQLIKGLDVRVKADGASGLGATLGGRTTVKRGRNVTVTFTMGLQLTPNNIGQVVRPAHADIIAGPVTGPKSPTDQDVFKAPGTKVVQSFDVKKDGSKSATFSYTFRNVQQPFYLRLRGSDGNQVDANRSPLVDVMGDANPWDDLWFYSNPIFVDLV